MAFDIKAMMAKYREDHQNPVNRTLHTIGIPMIVASLPVMLAAPPIGIGMFIVGWILQFVGHAFEGKMPSFFSDPRFLLVGPMWFVKKITGRGDAPAAS
jgi:uncharacterized membrane protein YGL010W